MSAIDEICELVEDGFDATPALYRQALEEYEAVRRERDDARLIARFLLKYSAAEFWMLTRLDRWSVATVEDMAERGYPSLTDAARDALGKELDK